MEPALFRTSSHTAVSETRGNRKPGEGRSEALAGLSSEVTWTGTETVHLTLRTVEAAEAGRAGRHGGCWEARLGWQWGSLAVPVPCVASGCRQAHPCPCSRRLHQVHELTRELTARRTCLATNDVLRLPHDAAASAPRVGSVGPLAGLVPQLSVWDNGGRGQSSGRPDRMATHVRADGSGREPRADKQCPSGHGCGAPGRPGEALVLPVAGPRLPVCSQEGVLLRCPARAPTGTPTLVRATPCPCGRPARAGVKRTH